MVASLLPMLLPGRFCWAQVSPTEAKSAMRRAVHFFSTQVATSGGYVFQCSDDLAFREGESAVGPTTAWIEPPATPAVGAAYLDAYLLTGERDLLSAAERTAEALLQGQMISGGWFEQIEFAPKDREKYAYRVDKYAVAGRRNITTFDDDKSQSVIRFLVKLDEALQQRDGRLHEATLYALDAVLAAQYPNGAWPQKYEGPGQLDVPVREKRQASYPSEWSRVFPDVKYTNYYTLNDSTLVDLIETLFVAWDAYGDDRYLASAKRGGDFLISAQMPAPQPGWAQQYNHEMQPAWARKFEPPAISGNESQGVMRTLLLLYRRTADERYLTPVRTALPYYRASLLDNGMLARFYELQTNRPLYFTKNYELTYSDADLPTHYSFSSTSGLDRIARELKDVESLPKDKLWSSKQSRPPKMTDELALDARRAIAALDERGAWVERGSMKKYPDAKVTSVISSSTFIRNLSTLAKYIAASQSTGQR
ncbi:pectate lyase [Neorhodopirellula pilleata]|uniref:Pectic acid lyase n=1 Tax=Neorhodopirellula pilleata TaxID=2714738 RepID=A0A5C6AVQ9_9BACT|nr:pectate lyase [Neorhodopirellula pilleata]TWU03146.1 Pectic acid lyase [Neorhodopirellula pilleata]